MPKVPVQFGEWRPDIATLDTQFSNDVENVFPGSNSYLPVPSLVPFADAVVPPPPSTEPVVGLFSARSTTGEWKIYAGTPTKLYNWTLFAGWTELGSGYHVPPGELWSFCQFGEWVVAAQIGDQPVKADADTGGTFTAITAAPVAHNVRTIGDFVILGGLASNRRMIQWSAINDVDGWTVGTNLSDSQGGSAGRRSGDGAGWRQDQLIRAGPRHQPASVHARRYDLYLFDLQGGLRPRLDFGKRLHLDWRYALRFVRRRLLCPCRMRNWFRSDTKRSTIGSWPTVMSVAATSCKPLRQLNHIFSGPIIPRPAPLPDTMIA